jgi:DNA mismatch repair protein MutS2
VRLKRARNPFLLEMGVQRPRARDAIHPVPVDIRMAEDKNVLVISGPNRGGKTVTLKTFGLLSLMAQTGLHIPAEEGSRLPVFDHVLAEIGDEQDIGAGLSTFSAHAAHLKDILDRSTRESLVVIDEPGMGTDPDEGVAMAMAVLDALADRGTFVAVSTHYNRLKSYALLNSRAINASVEFDPDEHRPNFVLRYGAPGISHGLDIAREVGIPPEVLDRAQGYLDQDEIRLNALIDKLNSLLMRASSEKSKASEEKERFRTAAERMKEALGRMEADKKALIRSKREEAEAAIAAAREELKEAINALKRGSATQEEVTRAYDRVDRRLKETLFQDPLEGHQETAAWEKGQLVLHRDLNQKGVVESVDASTGRAFLTLGRMRVSVPLEALEPLKDADGQEHSPSAKAISWDMDAGRPLELNVIGYRVADAIPLIEKTLDRALVEGEGSLTIIHGYGTGRLRGAIRDHLEGLPFVKSVSRGDERRGGDAVTVVELR